jgi:hypothetical protein
MTQVRSDSQMTGVLCIMKLIVISLCMSLEQLSIIDYKLLFKVRDQYAGNLGRDSNSGHLNLPYKDFIVCFEVYKYFGLQTV